MAADNVEVKVSADDSEMGRGLSGAAGKLRKFSDSAESEAERADKAWQQASKNVGKYMLGFSASMLAGFAGSAQTAGAFDQSLRMVNTTAHLSEKQLKALGQEVINLSKSDKVTKGPTELADALYEIYGAGLKGKEAMAVLTVGTKIADVALTDMGTATSGLVQTMMAYQLQAKDAAGVGDVLAKSVENGRMTMGEYNQVLGNVMSKGATFGLSIEEVSAAMAVLSQTMNMPEASTALERLITQMGAPTKEAAGNMDALGVSYGRSALQSKGLIGQLLGIEGATKGNLKAIRELTGGSSEAMNAFEKLMAGGGGKLKDFTKDNFNALNSLESQQAESLKGASKQWELFTKSLQVAAVQTGEVVLPTFTKIVAKAGELVKSYSDLKPSTQNLVIGSFALAGSVSAVIGGLAILGPTLASAGRTFTQVRGAIGAVFLATRGLLGPIGLATIAIGGLYVAWEKNWLGMRRITEESADAIREAMNGLKWPGFNNPDPPDIGQELRDRKKLMGGAKSTSGLKVQFTGKTPGLRAEEVLTQTGRPYAPPVLAAKPGPLPKPKYDQEGRDPIDVLKEQQKAEKAAEKKRLADERKAKATDLLRERILATAKSMEGMRFGSEGCARAIRGLADRAGVALPVETNPFDLKELQRLGLPVGGKDFADSLFGPNTGEFIADQKQSKTGDLVFFKNTYGDGKYGNAATHVGMVTGPNQMVHQGNNERGLTKAPIDQYGQENILGFVRPWALAGKKDKFSGADPGEEYAAKLKERRAKIKEIDDSFLSEEERKIAALEEDLKTVQAGSTGAEQESLRSKLIDQINFAQLDKAMGPGPVMVGGQPQQEDRAGQSFIDEQARQEELVRLSKEKWDIEFELAQRAGETSEAQRAANIEMYQERIGQITQLATLEGTTEATHTGLLKEKHALEQEIWAAQTEQADLDMQRKLEEWDIAGQLGEMDTARKLEWLNRELLAFQGSEQMKSQLMQQRRGLEVQMQMEQFAMADQVYQAIDQSFQSMLTSALEGQANFNQVFQNLWKQVSGQVISELAKMLLKALALQAVMRGIFGFFTGGLGGGADLGGALLGGGLGIAHSGGWVIPGGIESFHTGGYVGPMPNLSPDEVIAKLQTGEMVLSRQQVAGLSDLDTAGAYQSGPTFNISVNVAEIKQDVDIDRLGSRLGLEIQRRMQGKV